MGMDVGKVSIEYLPRPQGLAYEFIQELACEASWAGDGNAFGFYQRDEMEAKAREFAKGSSIAERILMNWIARLPWEEDGSLVLTFNW